MASVNEDLIDVRSMAQIVKSGDLLLNNPAETCIILVSVIIVSASLEYLLQIVTRIRNRYAHLMITTVTKELTIIGVLALVLMLASSLMPAGEQQDRYSILFTWANMNLFFMACFFVIVVVAQFLWAAFEQPKWRSFEEGRMDSAEADKLWFRERTYKAVFDRYSEELILTFGLSPEDCGLYEMIQVFTRRLLVNMSDLSWPVWLCLIPVIVLNGVRAYFPPVSEGDANYVFFNGMTYIASTGYFAMALFLLFLWVLQGRMQAILDKKVGRNVAGARHVPFGSPKRCIGILQAIIMMLNWYVSLFATGMGKDILTNAKGWQAAVMVIAFIIPLFVVHLLLPWSINILAFMNVLGSVQIHQRIVERVMRRHQGEDGGDDTEDDMDSDEEEKIRTELEKRAALNKELASRRASMAPPKRPMSPAGAKRPPPAFQPKALAVPQQEDTDNRQALQSEEKQRPGWMDDDDEWLGDTSAAATAKVKAKDTRRADPLFFEHIDDDDLRDTVLRRNPYLKEPTVEQRPKSKSTSGRLAYSVAEDPVEEADGEDIEVDYTVRPSWLEDDEPWF